MSSEEAQWDTIRTVTFYDAIKMEGANLLEDGEPTFTMSTERSIGASKVVPGVPWGLVPGRELVRIGRVVKLYSV